MNFTEYLNTRSEVQGFVTGNEACDADSFVSALITAFCLTQSTGRLYVPIAQCTREEFDAMKKEISVLFQHVDISLAPVLDRFLFVGNFSWSHLRPLVLTDHNEPTSEEISDQQVELVIDHHEVISDHPPKCPSIIERVGSCCTLVAREYWKFLDSPSKHLLLAVILLDTNNLTEKTTSADLEISSKLKQDLEISESRCREISDQINATRKDRNFWKSLAPKMQLKMDLKNFRTFAASTVRLGLHEISDQMEISMRELAEELKVKVFLLLTAHKGGREMTAWTETPEIMAHLERGIRESGLETSEIPSIGTLKSWAHTKDATRKQVAPVVARCLDEIKHLLE